ncbi:MAG: polyprenyl diphosphate synthase [Patescibacteria group bacterium]|mgnify:CR=1 FL=1
MKVPQHIAFIMDGNRRWAKSHHLPTLVGHSKGYDRIQEIVTHAQKLGIGYITFWAFSTENWNRSKEELDCLFDLFRKIFQGNAVKKLLKQGCRICVLGDSTRFPQDMQQSINDITSESAKNKGIVVNIALNYGGRAEILQAVTRIVQDNVAADAITSEIFSTYLYTAGQPDPDLIIRTGGNYRLSGYLPWQSIYSELYFTDTYWPDFDAKQLDIALAEFEQRERRFGK